MTPGQDLQRTARHEAGHAVADWAFGHEVEIVSIRPSARYLGVCQSANHPSPEGFRPELPVTRQPAVLRADVEGRVIAALVGPIAAESIYAGPRASRGTDPCEAWAESAVDSLPPRHRELLSDLETGTDGLPRDDEKALKWSAALAGDWQAPAYYGWLRQVAREFVAEYSPQIDAVAAALRERSVLTGEEVAAIAQGARRARSTRRASARLGRVR